MEKILKNETLYTGKVFSVNKLTIELSKGNIVDWEVVDKGGDSVAILPVDENNNITLVEEYFGAINQRLISLPKGMPEKFENFEDTAKRELQEEVGLIGDMEHLITMEVSPSYLKQRTIIFVARNLKKSKMIGDEREYIKPIKLSLKEAIQKIRSGEITEARTVASILLYNLKFSGE
jgi:ADP-ribose pyrophosphatase